MKIGFSYILKQKKFMKKRLIRLITERGVGDYSEELMHKLKFLGRIYFKLGGLPGGQEAWRYAARVCIRAFGPESQGCLNMATWAEILSLSKHVAGELQEGPDQ